MIAITATVALQILFSTPSFEPSVRNRVSVELGVPLPLSVYGYRSEDGASGLEFLGSLGFEYLRSVHSLTFGSLHVGGWIIAADIHGRDRDATADVYFVSLGVIGALEIPIGTTPYSTRITGALGLGAMFNGIIVDSSMRLQTSALGGLARLRFSLPISSCTSLGASATLELFSEPLNRARWFNAELHETVVVTLALGLTHSW